MVIIPEFQCHVYGNNNQTKRISSCFASLVGREAYLLAAVGTSGVMM